MEEKAKPNRRVLIVVVLVIILLLGATAVVLVSKGKPAEEEVIGNDVPPLGYAEGVTVVDDPNALQKAVDEMYAQAADPGITLEYKNDATSKDGVNFSCYIANAVENEYDMYIQIFADSKLTDQLYLSGLVRPGNAFRELELEHSLEAGNHTVYVAFTQVEEDLATIHNQVFVTMDFNVTK